MKILILNNRLKFDLNSELAEAKKYFSKYIDIDFDIKFTDIPVTIEEYKRVQGFDKNTGKPALIGYMGTTDDVRKHVASVSSETYDIVAFSYDQDDVQIPRDSVVTSWTMNNPLFPKTEYIQFAFHTYFKTTNRILMAICHEIVHALCFKANRMGIYVLDEMDNTIVNGSIVPFYKNDDIHAVDGNFAHTLKNLEPFFNYLKTSPVSKISENGIEFIKKEEGFSSVPYRDTAGVPTIGFGSTYCVCGAKVTMNTKPMSKNIADAIMRENVQTYQNAVSKGVKVPITQNQFDALVSLCYNIGVANFATSTLLRKLNLRDYKGASDQFPVWRLAGGKISQGLVNRRSREQKLFNS